MTDGMTPLHWACGSCDEQDLAWALLSEEKIDVAITV